MCVSFKFSFFRLYNFETYSFHKFWKDSKALNHVMVCNLTMLLINKLNKHIYTYTTINGNKQQQLEQQQLEQQPTRTNINARCQLGWSIKLRTPLEFIVVRIISVLCISSSSNGSKVRLSNLVLLISWMFACALKLLSISLPPYYF